MIWNWVSSCRFITWHRTENWITAWIRWRRRRFRITRSSRWMMLLRTNPFRFCWSMKKSTPVNSKLCIRKSTSDRAARKISGCPLQKASGSDLLTATTGFCPRCTKSWSDVQRKPMQIWWAVITAWRMNTAWKSANVWKTAKQSRAACLAINSVGHWF